MNITAATAREQARAQRDACRCAADALTGRATAVLDASPGHLAGMCIMLAALALEGHLEAARLRGLDDAGARAAVLADLERRAAAAGAV